MENAWADEGQLPHEVETCVQTLGGDLHALREKIATWRHDGVWAARRKELKHCMKVLRLETSPGQLLTASDLEGGSVFLNMIVDIGKDPLLHELGYSGRTSFRVQLFAYERYVHSSSSHEVRRELRVARVDNYAHALLFPILPYQRCSLPRPAPELDIHTHFPTDLDAASANRHMEKVVAAKATLAWLFWECFDTICDQVFKHHAGKTSKRADRGHHQAKLSECSTREEAMSILWTLMPANEYDLPFRCTITADDASRCNGLLGAVELAIHSAAEELEDLQPELVPSMWSQVPQGPHWPLRLRPLPGDEASEDDCFTTIEALVPIETELAFVECEAVLNMSDFLMRKSFTSVKSSNSTFVVEDDHDKSFLLESGLSREVTSCFNLDYESVTTEDKRKNVVLNLTRWRTSGDLEIMDIKTDSHWGIHETLEVVAQLEECAIMLSDSKLMSQVAQLAYGLRALQQAQIKQQLRDVGLIVVESERTMIARNRGVVSEIKRDMYMAWMEFSARLCGGASRLQARLSSFGSSHEKCAQRVMFVSAPNGVLQQCAATRKMLCTVMPDHRTGTLVGGFAEWQFERDGPSREFWIASKDDPYPYTPYFRPSMPGLDPRSILSPAERKYIVRSIITGPPSNFRLPDGRIDPCRGGADLAPRELISEHILEGFFPLGNTVHTKYLQHVWAMPWRQLGICRFLLKMIFLSQPRLLRLSFGPQIASYFDFLESYNNLLALPAILGLLAFFSGHPKDDLPLWRLWIPPMFGCVMVLWGTFVCSSWCRRVAYLTYMWDNGILEPGMELQTNQLTEARCADVRPEFALRFRRAFERSGRFVQQRMIRNLHRALNLHRAPGNVLPAKVQKAFNEKMLRRDVESFIETCFMPSHERALRDLVAVLASLFFIAISTGTTVLSMYIQDILATNNDSQTQFYSYVVSGLSSGLMIPALDMLHQWVAIWSTEWQALREDREHEAYLFMKLFGFSFFNTFNSLFYVAFWRRNMDQLQVWLVILMAGQFIQGNIREVFLPMWAQHLEQLWEVAAGEMSLQRFRGSSFGMFRGFRVAHEGVKLGGSLQRARRDMNDQLTRKDEFELVQEAIQMLIQFGMVTMFAGALPLVPTAAMLGTLIELRIDSYKLIRLQKFPEPRMSVGIGMPYRALLFITYFSLFINGGIVLLTKYQDVDKAGAQLMLPNMSDYERMICVVGVEHVLVLLIYLLLSWGRHGTSSSRLREEKYRQQYFDNREAAESRRDADDNMSGVAAVLRARRRREVNNNDNAEATEVALGIDISSS
eukprot:TRINITY_DN26577_c0_g1_i1.p1 TRINITY_DN26577_c0_g1~~TRINITY_DN26577_c0_g1_i1.p1  ORF type:complete len:1347 (-),score=171.61 TRINITY_DN26577_c0_g1_i1:327-4163(-)